MTMDNYTFDFNNLTIGNGTPFVITNIEGLGGTPALRIQDDNRGYLDGSYTGHDFYDERTIYIDVTVLEGDGKSAAENYLDLQSAFAPQSLGYYYDPTSQTPAADLLKEMFFKLNGAPQFSGDTGERAIWCRSRGLTTPISPEFTYGYIQTRIMLTAPDPRYYTLTTQSSASNAVTTVNHGWATSCPIINIASVNLTQGYIDDAEGPIMWFSGLTIGDELIVDLLTRTIYVNGVPARNKMNAATTGWLEINPNTTTTFTSNLGNMVIQYASAYI